MAKTNLHLRVYTDSDNADDRTAPQIIGEVRQIYHEGEIQLESWSWTHERKSQGGTKKLSEPSELKFTKLLDAATTPLLNYINSSAILPLVVVNMIDDPQQSPFALTVQFRKVRVRSYQVRGTSTGAGFQAMESWSMDYREVRFGYWPLAGGQWQAGGEVQFLINKNYGSVSELEKKKEAEKNRKPGETGAAGASGGFGDKDHSGAGKGADGNLGYDNRTQQRHAHDEGVARTRRGG